jgi:hypothetical protein
VVTNYKFWRSRHFVFGYHLDTTFLRQNHDGGFCFFLFRSVAKCFNHLERIHPHNFQHQHLVKPVNGTTSSCLQVGTIEFQLEGTGVATKNCSRRDGRSYRLARSLRVDFSYPMPNFKLVVRETLFELVFGFVGSANGPLSHHCWLAMRRFSHYHYCGRTAFRFKPP